MAIESLEYTARIRARATDKMGDDLPEDLHHDYRMVFDGSESADLCAQDDRNKEKRIPLTKGDVLKILGAFQAYENMKALEADHA